jgi:hypothetical protein
MEVTKKDKKAKKENGSVETNVVATKKVRLKKQRQSAELEVIGQLGELLGKGSTFGLYSERNFQGDARVLIAGWENNSDSKRGDYKFVCDESFSKDLRMADSEEEFNELLDSIEFADVVEQEVQAVTRKGQKMYDSETGEPVMETVYYLNFGDTSADVSNTKRAVAGKAKERKEKKRDFSWERVIGGIK